MRIFLVRHGESEGNVNRARYQTVADHAIQLTEKGRGQAKKAGIFLRAYLEKNPREGLAHALLTESANKPRMWTSPYARAKQTADEFCVHLGDKALLDRRVNIRLREQEFGLLNGIAGQEVAETFPHVDENYKRHKRWGGKFYAKNPSGESRADVCDRVHMFSGTLKRDYEKHNVKDVIIVCHGTTLRAFVMEWLHLDVEWFEEEPNPGNCAIRLLHRGQDGKYMDGGYIWGGADAY